MATILRSEQREFQESPGKIDKFRIYTDVSRTRKGINPENLNFDLREPREHTSFTIKIPRQVISTEKRI